MKGLPQLRDLSLNGTKVTDAGLLHLAGLTHLKTIRLNRTDITDRGLTQLKRLTHLEKLEVRETLVTDAGVDELRQVISNCASAGQECMRFTTGSWSAVMSSDRAVPRVMMIGDGPGCRSRSSHLF